MSAPPILDLRNLAVDFVGRDGTAAPAIAGIDLQLQPGQILGLVGESGSGKSVTALSVMGLLPETARVEGEIWFRSDPKAEPIELLGLDAGRRRQLRGRRLAQIFQEPTSALNPLHTIGFQLVEAIRQHRQVSAAEARRQAIARLQEVCLLPGDGELRAAAEAAGETGDLDRAVNARKRAMLARYPHQLSGGQLQRVVIAIAIACNPTLLLADEPTTALDVTVQKAILLLLRQLCRERGMTAIFISHDLAVVAELADTVAVMYRGKIVETGAVAAIFSQPQHPYTRALLACRPHPETDRETLLTVDDFMRVVTDADGGWQVEALTPADAPARVSPPPAAPESAPLLQVRNLQVGFRQPQARRYLMAVNDVSFEVYGGETLGLVGESGCGKSTLARTLLRLIEPLGGTIAFDGEDLLAARARRLRALRCRLQIVFQNPYSSLNPRLSVGEAIAEPLRLHGRHARRQRSERVAALLERVGLDPSWGDRYPHEFSGGQRQRVCIARALALNPDFIICDESVSALDVSVQARVLNLLKDLQREFGLTYIFISHDLGVVRFMSDRIMVMKQGRIEEIGAAAEIYQQPQSPYTQQLLAAIPTGFDPTAARV